MNVNATFAPDSTHHQGPAVIGRMYDLAGKLEVLDKARSAALFCIAAQNWRKRITALTTQEVTSLKRAILKSGSLFRELATLSAEAGDKAAAAHYWLKASESFKQSISPLVAWQSDARDHGPARAGTLYRELALDAEKANDKAAAADHWYKSAESFGQSPVALAEWQATTRDQGPARAGSLYQRLAVEAATEGRKAAAADYWLRSSESFQQASSPLADWQIDARDFGAARAGSLYRELAADAADRAFAAQCWMQASESFQRSKTPLATWQDDVRVQGPARAGSLYRESALEAEKAGDKTAAAEHWTKAASCFQHCTTQPADWQIDARDRGPARAGSIYRELAVQAQKAGNKANAAQYWMLAAQSFMQAAVPLAEWQVDVRDQGLSRAATLYRELALEAEKQGDKSSAADFWLRASEALSQASAPVAASQPAARDDVTSSATASARDSWLSKLKKLAN